MFDHRYIFRGAVLSQYGYVLQENYLARVYAKTKENAVVKLLSQFKRMKKLNPNAILCLDGSLELELI